ncbi:Conserved hypothetical membrane protein [Candidatus Protochlamydia naegleriophila]|uniref:Conserved hypothetical membrane protein n=1 Tax=Candidatus Protochlamydia naegleriophila TaxID=389348 RepID=A0A0U5JGQ1_9BACT|nr:hypothetical protein [Candidatus Protochlamydia naegleriophila]CUI17599.1 Conserved hypothetical membrane protein [Candidatus Protochlamydia naegleriophila]
MISFYPPLEADISYLKSIKEQYYHVGTRLEMSALKERIAQVKDRIFVGRAAYWSGIGACLAAASILVNPIAGTIALTVSTLSFFIFRDVYLMRKAYSEQFCEVSEENLNTFVDSDTFHQIPVVLPLNAWKTLALKDQGVLFKSEERRSKEIDAEIMLLTPLNEERFIYEQVNCPAEPTYTTKDLPYHRFNSFPSSNQFPVASSQWLKNL